MAARGVYKFNDQTEGESDPSIDSLGELFDSFADASTTMFDYHFQASDAQVSGLDELEVDEDQALLPLPVPPFSLQVPDTRPPQSPPRPAAATPRHPMKHLIRQNGKPLKTAYFRIQLIRAFKKSIQHIATRKWARAGIFQLDKGEEGQRQMWADYYCRYKERKGLFSQEAWGLLHDNKEKSFGNAYCRRIFQCEAVRIMYFHFIQIVFHPSLTPEAACRKLKLRCCSVLTHTDQCSDVWLGVKRYAGVAMIYDLGLEPWNGEGWGDVPDTSSFLSIPH